MGEIITLIDLENRIEFLIYYHGGLSETARILNIDKSYLKRLHDGSKTNPSDETLKKLGLKKIISYTKIGDE